MQSILQNLIIGLQVGAVYALIAVGYTMVYGVLRLINFAHGDVYMVGAYVGLTLARQFGFEFTSTPFGFAVVFFLTTAICALIGVLIERLAYRPLRSAPRITALITAIGISLFIEAGAQMIWGANPQFFPRLWAPPAGEQNSQVIQLAGVTISASYLWILLASVILMSVLWYVVVGTRIGKAMRAVAWDREAAALMGVNPNMVIAFTFALGSALAGAAGFIVSALTNVRIAPLVGVLPGLKAFVAAVLGGIGSIPGAMVGGLVMGIAETFVAANPKITTWRDAIAFILLILILIFRPAGIMGRAVVEKV
ncbi:MAG: inner-rane translocator [Armatimonadetes bacterium]|jgi:branched-chain amino acid transport system permease protein|nr:inner-rane translocator [Armatimonadota bacterium]